MSKPFDPETAENFEDVSERRNSKKRFTIVR